MVALECLIEDDAPTIRPPSVPPAGEHALSAFLRLTGRPVDAGQITAAVAGLPQPLDGKALVAVAHRLGAPVRRHRVGRRKLAGTRLPALAEMAGGEVVLIARADAERVLLLDTAANRPVEQPRSVFDAAWTGHLITSAPVGTARPFGLAWFLPALGRHAGVLSQVTLASLCIQLFGLATPLFSMIVIDKVLSSGTMTTLDVLAIGMAAMAVFDFLMGALRAALLSHTTNKVDVELGSRLFEHLMALPLAFFESRPVGALAARVKELDSVRALLTGPGLTVLMDVLFTLIFIAVMWSFSPYLTGIVLVTLLGFALVHGLLAPLLKARLTDRFAKGPRPRPSWSRRCMGWRR